MIRYLSLERLRQQKLVEKNEASTTENLDTVLDCVPATKIKELNVSL